MASVRETESTHKTERWLIANRADLVAKIVGEQFEKVVLPSFQTFSFSTAPLQMWSICCGYIWQSCSALSVTSHLPDSDRRAAGVVPSVRHDHRGENCRWNGKLLRARRLSGRQKWQVPGSATLSGDINAAVLLDGHSFNDTSPTTTAITITENRLFSMDIHHLSAFITVNLIFYFTEVKNRFPCTAFWI